MPFLRRLYRRFMAFGSTVDPMRTSRTLVENATVSLLVAIVGVAVLVWTPVYVGFVCATASAFCWCLWLERHPAKDPAVGERELPFDVALDGRVTSRTSVH
jgi:hypothetical protein